MKKYRTSLAASSSAIALDLDSWVRAAILLVLFIGFIVMSGCGSSNASNDTIVTPPALALPSTESANVAHGATATISTTTGDPTAAEAGRQAAMTPVPAADRPPTVYSYEVVATFPHDPNAFTQGLLFDQGVLYEGTGLYGESTLRRVDLTTGTVEEQIALPGQYFGEGVAIVDDRIYQLTWQEETGFIYDKRTLEQVGQFSYTTEGWGLTYDGTHLIMSDGTEHLYFLNPTTLDVEKQLAVSLFDPSDQSRKAVIQLNELEYIDGELFANIWQTDTIVRINPANGNVTGLIDLTGLLPAEERTAATDVLNGIAYLPEGKRLFVTGKKWPKLFEIQLVQQ